jgi:hypothetical protein
MKDEVWSIRKMREMQKQSKTRNTYKKSEVYELSPESIKTEKTPNKLFNTLFDGILMFLEE